MHAELKRVLQDATNCPEREQGTRLTQSLRVALIETRLVFDVLPSFFAFGVCLTLVSATGLDELHTAAASITLQRRPSHQNFMWWLHVWHHARALLVFTSSP